MKILLIFVLSLLAFPSQAQQFDTFLPKFRKLYDGYHFGKKWERDAIDKEAARIWKGSGGQYEYASITASQGVFETHFDSDPYVYGHRGNFGMRVGTILAEGIRIGIIKKKPEDEAWLLKRCRKDPGYADYLAASRLVFLVTHCGTEKQALRTWVRGPLKYQKEVDRKASLDYANGVLRLKQIQFGGQK